MLLKSAKKCLDSYGLKPDRLSRILVNKYYGDNLLPMTASRLQGKLNSNTAMHAFDVDGGITSFLHSVDLISRYIDTGDEYILLSSGGYSYKTYKQKRPQGGISLWRCLCLFVVWKNGRTTYFSKLFLFQS